MPAKNLHRNDEKGIYSHVYNKGIEKRLLFNDEKDYEVFLGFLRDSLTPYDPQRNKKVFTVRGREFQGLPHQPKNHFDKIELVAYSLMPDHYHLLLHQTTHGSLKNFIRSLCTRYSIYYNKKYQRTGALLEGPYKSIQIPDEPHLLHLTYYFHHTGSYSSYPEYLGTRATSWVKPKGVLSFFGKGTDDYKDVVETYELDQKEKEFIETITIEHVTQHHSERRGLTSNVETYHSKIYVDPYLNPFKRVLGILTTAIVFSLLLILGIRNVEASKHPRPLPAPPVLEETKPKTTLTIKMNNGSESVTIHQKPTINAKKIGEAKDGDTFEFISLDSEWFEIKLADGSTGFISAAYVK